MLAEVMGGLARDQKELSPKYFYDAQGSRLFEQITMLEEYYPTRTERALLMSIMPALIPDLASVSLVELGAGSAAKSRIILDAMRDAGTLGVYVPIDVSADFLAESARRLRSEYSGLRVVPWVADISADLHLPTFPRPALFAFLGSTIGNFEDPEAIALLRRVAAQMQPGDRFLMGADLVKDIAVLEAAYNDAKGVTADFNLNLLSVLNRELGANFDPAGYRHHALYNAAESRIEMHLVSERRQAVEFPGGGTVRFDEGESVRTEISRKFTRTLVGEMFAAAGLAIERWETDPHGWYALTTATLIPTRRRARLSGNTRLLAPLREDLRRNAFALAASPAPRPGLLGAEIELIALRAEDGLPSPIESEHGMSTIRVLRDVGKRRGWIEELSPKGTRRFRLPGQGTISFEPGGQLEFSSLPGKTISQVLGNLRDVIPSLRRAASDAGILLLEVGIDPQNPIAAAPLQLFADRYVKMARYFDTIGPAGSRMMRQTAALHVNLDFGDQNMLRWRVLNAAAPYLTAIFANSSRYAGADTGYVSARTAVWRELDPARTGTLPVGPVAEDEYLDFALTAPAMLLDPVDGRYLAFGDHWSAGTATLEDWRDHLSTLFPDIRPRGYLEVRCLDAIPAEWYPAPLTLLAGLLYDPATLQAADELLGSPNASLLSSAALAGLADPQIGGTARDLFQLGLAGAATLGSEYVADGDREVAGDFFSRYTRGGHCLADFTASGQ